MTLYACPRKIQGKLITPAIAAWTSIVSLAGSIPQAAHATVESIGGFYAASRH